MKTFFFVMTLFFWGGAIFCASRNASYAALALAFASGWHFHMWLGEGNEKRIPSIRL